MALSELIEGIQQSSLARWSGRSNPTSRVFKALGQYLAKAGEASQQDIANALAQVSSADKRMSPASAQRARVKIARAVLAGFKRVSGKLDRSEARLLVDRALSPLLGPDSNSIITDLRSQTAISRSDVRLIKEALESE